MKTRVRHSPILGRCLRKLPGDSALFGPPRRIATALDHANAHDIRLVEATAGQRLPVDTSLIFGRPTRAAITGSRSELPPVWVGDLPGGRLLWPEGSVVTANDTLIKDTSFWTLCDDGGLQRHPLGLRWKAPPQKQLPGKTLALTADFANASFGHFVLDALPRLEHLRRAGRSLREFDSIVVPTLRSPTLDRLCAAAGLPPERVLRLPAYEDLVCEHLTFTTYPGWPGTYSSDTPGFYRRILSLPPTPGWRRIYLSRQNQARRRLVNADEVEALLSSHGFETVFPETDPDTIRKCSEASIIVGIEGSNMVNQVFAPAGGTVLLLVDDQWNDLPYVYSLATACGNRFMAVVGEARDIPSDPDLRWANPHNLFLPLESLEQALRTAIAPAQPRP